MELKTDKIIYHVETLEDLVDLAKKLDALGCSWKNSHALTDKDCLTELFSEFPQFCLYLKNGVAQYSDRTFYERTYPHTPIKMYKKQKQQVDVINNPKYYQGRLGLKAIEVHRNFMTDEQLCGYHLGNTLKYLLRYQNKNGLEDLKKARKHLEWLIEQEKMKGVQ